MSQPPCLICSAPSNFAHFGVNSCRSCADFFKRSVLAERIFTCRQGNGKCLITHRDRHNCRGCRFEKCKQIGMKLTDQKTTKLQPLNAPAQSNEKILARVCREYLASVERRKMNEYTLRPTSLHRHVKVNHIQEDLMLCSWSYLIDCIKMFAGEYIRFATDAFPEFAALSLDDQRLMLNNFATRLWSVESQFGTYRIFGSHDGPYFMASLATCFDSRNFKFFTEEENPASCEEIARMTKHYSEKGKTLLGPILMKSKFTDTEYAIIFGLSIWQIDLNQHLPEHLVAMSETIRRNVIEDLKKYYQEELSLDNYSVRLGNLITFEHTIQECTNLFREELQMFNLAGMMNGDIPFLQTVIQIPL
ncbi:hypothetical protein PENTCL1PPCAC_17245 [Pristionchus entomophagus]|uniref:Nuclear receptor n=1 Tax=Pristionchus entomophagus TaxID=358040 RepID=A0AAV5TL99_9BILA|nr:hypothetical protein PENTCL1PPCAC_17245 [Pristionchus entomophagus]